MAFDLCVALDQDPLHPRLRAHDYPLNILLIPLSNIAQDIMDSWSSQRAETTIACASILNARGSVRILNRRFMTPKILSIILRSLALTKIKKLFSVLRSLVGLRPLLQVISYSAIWCQAIVTVWKTSITEYVFPLRDRDRS